MQVLLLVIDSGYADHPIQLCKALHSAYVDWYLGWVGAKHEDVRRWDKRLHLYATRRRDARPFAGIYYDGRSVPLGQIKCAMGDWGDVDALRWLLEQRQGLVTSTLDKALRRNDMAIVEVIVEHCRDDEKAFKDCMYVIGKVGAEINSVALLKRALLARHDCMPTFAYQAATNGHLEALQCCLALGTAAQPSYYWRIMCKQTHQYPLVHAALREAGCLCDCAK